MLLKQVLLRLYNLLVLVLFTVFVYGQDVEIKEHPLYQSVVPTINNNQPDSFEIKMAQYFGNPEDSAAARGLIELALDLGIRTESKRWELEACHELSVFYSKNGDKQTALRYARKAESLLPYGTLHHQLRNNNLQGIYFGGLGDHENATCAYSRGITSFENAADKAKYARMGVILYFNRSSAYFKRDNSLLALSDCLKALEYAELNEQTTRKLKYRLMSRLYMIQKDFGDAQIMKPSLLAVSKLALENRTPYDTVMALGYQIEMASSVDEAEQCFDRGLAIADKYNLPVLNRADLRHRMSLVYKKHGMFCQQEELTEQIISLYPDTSMSSIALLLAHTTRSRFLLERGKTEEAIYWARQIIEASKELGNKELALNATRLLSEAYAEQKDFTAAYRTKIAEGVLRDSMKSITSPAILIRTYLKYQHDQEKKIMALKAQQNQALLSAKVVQQRILIGTTVLGMLLLCGVIYLLLKNIRNKRRSEASLLEQQKLLLKKNEKLKQFSRVVSHDILSNLELIISTGNIVVGENGNKKQLSTYFENTQQAALKLKKYCLGLLESARTETAAFTSRSEVEAIVKELLAHYSPKLTQLQFVVTAEMTRGVPLPPAVVSQFLHNGISNAIKYVPQQGRLPRLRIGGGPGKGGAAYLFIEDNGQGIDAKTKGAILTGQRIKKNVGSQGIGLATLKTQLQIYNLALELNDAEGGGLQLAVTKHQESGSG